MNPYNDPSVGGQSIIDRFKESTRRDKNLEAIVDRMNKGQASNEDKIAIDNAIKNGKVRPPMVSKSANSDSSKSSTDETGDWKSNVAKGIGQSIGSGGSGNTMDTAGNLALMSGNPYAMAAGGALKVLGAVRAKREKIAEQTAQAENDRRARLESVFSRLGSGVGSMGMA